MRPFCFTKQGGPMAGKLLHMNKQMEILRLKGLNFSQRKVAKILDCSRDTIKKYWNNPTFPLLPAENPLKLDLEESRPTSPPWVEQVDWKTISEELEKGTPIKTLWEELCEEQKIHIEYPGFWKQLSKKLPLLKKSMHRVFQPGERIEIDYADGIKILDPHTGELISTQLFVGVLCYSRYIYAEFSYSQKSEDFLSSHVRMFDFFQGSSQVISPDNLKAAVTKAHRYDPEINPAYQKLAAHYQVAVVPARVRTPKDKAIVERTIQIFQRWFYFKVRKKTFTSLMELNQCLKEHLEVFHEKKHRIFQKSRKEMFEIEKSALKSLPIQSFQVQSYHQARLSEDCHFVFDKNYYSAPYNYRGKVLELWISANTIEAYSEGHRIAIHPRSKTEGKFITDTAHYPPEHQAYAEVTPQSVILKAKEIGPETESLIENLLSGPYPLQNLRRAQGILALTKAYSKAKVEEASQQANTHHQNTLRYLKRILKLKTPQSNLSTSENQSKKIERDFNPFLRGNCGLFH